MVKQNLGNGKCYNFVWMLPVNSSIDFFGYLDLEIVDFLAHFNCNNPALPSLKEAVSVFK